MNFIKTLAIVVAALICSPLFASVTVSYPSNNSQVTSPFALNIPYTPFCKGVTTTALGYSIDESSNTTIINNTSFNGYVLSGTGQHILHVKCWGAKTADVTNINLTVIEPVFPPNITEIHSIQTDSNWLGEHDEATNGTSTASSKLVTLPSLTGVSRQFTGSYTDFGGSRFSSIWGNSLTATHFIYDTWLFFPSMANIANVEMDTNQVVSNGDTVIYAFQCEGSHHVWDYTFNTGTLTSPIDGWTPSAQSCDPQTWTANTWHHIQIEYYRVGETVTYQSVVLDGNLQYITASDGVSIATGFSGNVLQWSPLGLLQNQFQLDGNKSSTGSFVAYMDDFTMYYW